MYICMSAADRRLLKCCVRDSDSLLYLHSAAGSGRVPADSLRESRSLSYSPPRYIRAAQSSPKCRFVSALQGFFETAMGVHVRWIQTQVKNFSLSIITANIFHLLSPQWQQTVSEPLIKQQQQQKEELRKRLLLFVLFFFPPVSEPPRTVNIFFLTMLTRGWLVHFFLWAHLEIIRVRNRRQKKHKKKQKHF